MSIATTPAEARISGNDWVGLGIERGNDWVRLGNDWVGLGAGRGNDWVGLGSQFGNDWVGFGNDWVGRGNDWVGRTGRHGARRATTGSGSPWRAADSGGSGIRCRGRRPVRVPPCGPGTRRGEHAQRTRRGDRLT